jgi:hypothetical protein
MRLALGQRPYCGYRFLLIALDFAWVDDLLCQSAQPVGWRDDQRGVGTAHAELYRN